MNTSYSFEIHYVSYWYFVSLSAHFVYTQILMNAVKAQMAVDRSALTQLDRTYVAVILDIGLPLTYMHAMVLLLS